MTSSRDLTRDLRRLAGLYNGVAMEQMMATCWAVLVDSYMSSYDNVLEIDAQVCWRPISDTPLFGENVSEAIKRTFVSINRCVAVIVYNSAWLAYCSSGLNVDLVEKTITEPKRVHEIELRFTHNLRPACTDYFHTVLLLKPRTGEEVVVADASYAQYSFDNGIDTWMEYLATKVCGDSRFEDKPFPNCSQSLALSEEDVWEQSKTKSIIRTTNNVVVRELQLVGGFEALLNMSEEHFQEARDRIFAAMKTELAQLRRCLERIKYGPDASYLQDLDDLVTDCDGPGHQTCMLSYERSTSPLRFSQLFTA